MLDKGFKAVFGHKQVAIDFINAVLEGEREVKDVLKNMNLFDMSPFKEKEAAFRRLLDVANLNALTTEERAEYDEHLKNHRDWRATLEYAVEEAGLLIAANMKKQGVDMDNILKCTGLSLEDVESLK